MIATFTPTIPSAVVDRASDQPIRISRFYSPPNFRQSEAYEGPTLETIYRDIHRHLVYVINASTIEEFRNARDAAFPEIHRLVLASIPFLSKDRSRVTSSATTEELPEFKGGILDKSQAKRVCFNLTAIEASGNFINKMENLAIPHDCLEKDNKLLEQYSIALGWVQMNFRCLFMLCEKSFQGPANPDITEELVRGTDVAVEVYAIVRQAADLREGLFPDSPQHERILWDEEDEALANAP